MGNLLDLFVFKYNRTDFHELNLDWIISDVQVLAQTLENFININTIKYADPIQWSIASQYEANTVVIDEATSTAYLSTHPVPVGVAITNTDYWTPIFSLNIGQTNNNITLRDDGNNVLSTFTSVIGDWILWNGTLYKVIHDIELSQAYHPGYNIERYTVELFVRDYITALNNIIGDLDDLTTTDKSNLVAAINELVSAVGVLNNLTTTDKSNLVAAINELVTKVNALIVKVNNLDIINVKDYGATGDGDSDDTQAFIDAMNAVNVKGGVLWIPSGSYIITQPLVITHAGVHITGTDKNSTYLFVNADINAIECIGSAGQNISAPFVENLSIENTSGASTKSAIYFEYTSNCLIDKVITNHFKIGFNLSHSGNGKVSNTFTVSDISGAVGYVHRNRSVSTVYYNISCTFTGEAASTGFGFLANEGNVSDCNINYFDCANGKFGILFNGLNSPTGTSISDVNLFNIVCDGQRESGIYLGNGSELASVNVIGAWLNPQTGVTPVAKCIEMTNMHNVNITGCNCQQMATSAPNVRGIDATNAVNCNFVNNHFINLKNAIACVNGTDNVVQNNNVTIYGTTPVTDIAILVYDGIISGNNISGYYNFGIIGRGDDCIITSNRVKNCTTPITNSATVNAVTDDNIS